MLALSGAGPRFLAGILAFGVPPAIRRLEQGELRARMRTLAAGEDPHRRRLAGQLVPVRAAAQQPGQLGDVGFFDPSRPGARRPASAQAPAARRSRTSPRPSMAICQAGSGTSRSAACSRSPGTQPVGQLISAAPGQRVQPGDQAVAGPGPHRR
jgi:hypothetical protein